MLIENGIKLEYEEIRYGDRYCGESGEQCLITLHGEEYCIGHSITTEDADDWAQAETYENSWCQNSKQEHIDPKIVYELIINYKQDKRNNVIDGLLS